MKLPAEEKQTDSSRERNKPVHCMEAVSVFQYHYSHYNQEPMQSAKPNCGVCTSFWKITVSTELEACQRDSRIVPGTAHRALRPGHTSSEHGEMNIPNSQLVVSLTGAK